MLSLILLSFGLISSAEANNTINLKTYLNKALDNDLETKRSELNTENAGLQAQQSSDLYASTIRTGPYYFNRELEGIGINASSAAPTVSHNYAWGWGAGINQKLPTGTTIDLSGSKRIDTPEQNISTSGNLAFEFSQSLGKNFLGRQDRKKAQAFKQIFKANQIASNQQSISSCSIMTQNYLTAYLGQESVKIYAQRRRQAERLKGISRKLYRDKLIRKIEWLAAQSDALQAVSTELEQKENYNKSLQRLFFYMNSIPNLRTTVLSDPEKYVTPLKSKRVAQKHPLVKQFKKLGDAYDNLANFYDDENGMDVTLSYIYQKNSLGTTPQVNYDQVDQNISLNLSWPLVSKSLDSQSQQAKVQADFYRLQAKLKESELEQAREASNRNANLTKNLYSQSQQRMGLMQTQIKEAERLYRTGKMEFEEYLRYRDRYYQEALQNITYKMNHLSFVVQEQEQNGDSLPVCGGKS